MIGDGYQHSHKDAAHPFTKKETFEGVTLASAVEVGLGKAVPSELLITNKVSVSHAKKLT